jgi:hypothetical protein
MNAMEPICATLDKEFGLSLFEQYNEYEENECYEAKFIRRLLKLKRFSSILKTRRTNLDSKGKRNGFPR